MSNKKYTKITDHFKDNEFINKNRPLTFLERLYFIEIFKGLAVTIKHFLYNFFNFSKLPTIDYPDKKRKIPASFRGRHRLTLRPDGTTRCVACFLCSTACPADCIYIEAGEYSDGNPNEKYPLRYEIDMLRCVFCGLCVEACPCDAIRMDTGLYDLADYSREDLIFTKEKLTSDYPPLKERGGAFNAEEFEAARALESAGKDENDKARKREKQSEGDIKNDD